MNYNKNNQPNLGRISYIAYIIAITLGSTTYSLSAVAAELNNANIDTINNQTIPPANAELDTTSNYISNNDVTSGNGRWLDMWSTDNNNQSHTVTINSNSDDNVYTVSVSGYTYTTSAFSDPAGALAANGNITLNGNFNFSNNTLASTNPGNTVRTDDVTGGAISSSNLLTIDSGSNGNVTFSGNKVTAFGAQGKGSNIKGVNSMGGAIQGANGVTLTGTGTSSNINNWTSNIFKFENNKVESIWYSAFGGAIYTGGSANSSGITLTSNNNSGNILFSFSGNEARGSKAIGGALYAASGGTINFEAANSVYLFDNNHSYTHTANDDRPNNIAAHGGAIGTAEGGENGVAVKMNATNSIYTFTNNSAELNKQQMHNDTINKNYGGAIYVAGTLELAGKGSKYEFSNNKVVGNTADGGAIAVQTSSQMYDSTGNGSQVGSLTLTNSNITNNQAVSNKIIGGQQTATAYGGAIYLGGANFTMSGNNSVTDNSAEAIRLDTSDTAKTIAAGGAIYSTSAILKTDGEYVNEDLEMNFITASGETITFENNTYSTTTSTGTTTTDNDIYWDGKGTGGSHTVTIDTAENSSVKMLSSLGSSTNAIVDITKTGAGTWFLGNTSNFLGKTAINIDGGTLKFNDNNTAIVLTNENSIFNIGEDGTVIGNYGSITGNVNNSGKFYLGEVADISTSTDLTALSKTVFTINGNYIGDNGTLYLKSVLGDDDSLTEKLVINGNASGTTNVTVTNLGGLGAQTIEGIKIIDVTGSSSDTAFTGQNIIAGKYEYSLVKGNTNKTDTESWFLSSKETGSDTPTIRPESGSYLANLVAANTLFNLRLHDRIGETQYTDLFTGEEKVTSMWIRYHYGYNKYKDTSDQLKIRSNWNLAQLGGDIAQWSSNDLNRLHLGLMAGYGHSSNTVDSDRSIRQSDSTINGYSFGAYGTWYSNEADKTGLYVDTWAQWSKFHASVDVEGYNKEKYDLDGFSASVESGYSFLADHFTDYDLWLQPKAQVTWMGVDADRHVENNGTVITGDSHNIQTRLGLKTLFSNTDAVYQRLSQRGQVFLEANWLYNTKPFAVSMDGEKVQQAGVRNIGEVKVGVEGTIRANTNLWFNFAHQIGDHNYSNSSILAGVKYSF